MRLEDACTPTFARHETFHPRLAWFRKGFLAASRDDGDFFSSPEAPLRLGVGKNMVRSIRFWTSAAHLIVDQPHPEHSRVKRTLPTNVGVGLLGPDGADAQMEDPATWWWLHWLMMSPGSQLPIWWIILNEMKALEFGEELAERVCSDALEGSLWDSPNVSSIQKDISAFIRTYTAPATSGRGKFDDQFGCPLRELRLIAPSPTGYRLSTGRPRHLPGSIVLAAALDFIAITQTSASTISLSRLVADAGGPGRAFRLDEETFLELIEQPLANCPDLTISAPAGTIQIGWRRDPGRIAHETLCDYYDVESETSSLAGTEARMPNLDAEMTLLLTEQARKVVL